MKYLKLFENFNQSEINRISKIRKILEKLKQYG